MGVRSALAVTAGFERGDKLPLSAAQGVTHAWLIDPIAQTVEVLRLDGSSYRLITTVAGSAEARLEPFDAVPLLLGDLWAR